MVVHWSNSHPLREDLLLRMADQFNDANHETSSGRPIEIKIVECDSAVQAKDLVARVNGECCRRASARSTVRAPTIRRS